MVIEIFTVLAKKMLKLMRIEIESFLTGIGINHPFDYVGKT